MLRDKRGTHPNSLKNLEAHKFKKGNPGGPGRKKGHVPVTELVRQLLGKEHLVMDPFENKVVKRPLEEIITLKLIEKAMAGDIKAIKEIYDRRDGKSVATNLNVTADSSHDEWVKFLLGDDDSEE